MAHYVNLLRGRPFCRGSKGYSLIETIIVVIVLGILATVTVRSLRNSTDVARTARTTTELDRIAWAIAGNPASISEGRRTDFGYVGDIGSLPPDLNALTTNPGSFATWDGPYLTEEFSLSGTGSVLLVDGWGKAYGYSGGPGIASTGGGFTITKNIAANTDDLLYNQIRLTILDLYQSPPGNVYHDSVRVSIAVPDGAGSTTSITRSPGADGFLFIDSLPIGLHQLLVVYTVTADTLTRMVTIMPGQTTCLDTQFGSNFW